MYGTDLTQRRTREWHALESNPLSTKISNIHHRVWVDALVKYARRKHSQQALTEYRIMQIVRGGKVSRLHDFLVIRGKTFAIVQQFETPYS